MAPPWPGRTFAPRPGGASLGWFTPLALSGLQLKSFEGQLLVEVQQLEAEGPWWKLIASRPDLGQFRIQRPRVALILSSDGSNFDAVGRPPSQGQADTTLTADIQDGSFFVRDQEADAPSVRIEDVSLKVRLERAGDERVLTIDPIAPLDHAELTEPMCQNGLQLIVPDLVIRTRGSVGLDETLDLVADTNDQRTSESGRSRFRLRPRSDRQRVAGPE